MDTRRAICFEPDAGWCSSLFLPLLYLSHQFLRWAVHSYTKKKKMIWTFITSLEQLLGFPGGSVVKNLPAKQKMQVRSLGQEDPLEEGTTTNSSILAWEIPWTEELGRLESMGSQRVRHDLVTKQQQWTIITTLKKFPLSREISKTKLKHSLCYPKSSGDQQKGCQLLTLPN